MMNAPAAGNRRFTELLALLDLEEIETNIFRGQNEAGQVNRLFGGQVLSQALVAAGRTVEGRPPHSLHGYFLRPGNPRRPVLYSVTRIRDGRSFTTRLVVALQQGKAILNLAASFHQNEAGYEHQSQMPEAPPPEKLTSWMEQLQKLEKKTPDIQARIERGTPPFEFRFVHPPTYLGGAGGADPDPNLIWIKANGELPDDAPLLHYGFLTYASDMSLIDTIMRHHPDARRHVAMAASLDHALWFHRPFRADRWMLYAQDSPSASGARGYARGALFDQNGVRIASTAQEGLVRRKQKS